MDHLHPDYLTKKYEKFVYIKNRYTTHAGSFANKYTAAASVDGDINQITFDVDDRWRNIDFSKKPNSDYFTLVNKRAVHIRENYEYVRLWLSGGWDSYTALKGFIDTSSHIDEIIIVQKYLYSPAELNNFEEHSICRRILDYHQDDLFNTKITFLDYDRHHFNRSFNQYNWPEWCFGQGCLEFRSAISLLNPFFEFPSLLELFDQNVKVADVIGLEKSVVKKINNQWHQLMVDGKFTNTIGRPGAVPFFNDPTFPDLYVLDSHLRAQAVDENKSTDWVLEQTRHKHPFFNVIAHQYIRKYSPVKSGTVSEKSVIMEVEASLNEATAHLVGDYYTSMQKMRNKYPTLFEDNWPTTQGVVGHFGLASSLVSNHNDYYHNIVK